MNLFVVRICVYSATTSLVSHSLSSILDIVSRAAAAFSLDRVAL